MIILLTVIHVIVCLFLIVVVLLQSGKAADLAGAFGGMGSQTVFGPRGSATALSRATTIAAALFMVTSLTLSIMATRAGGGSSGTLLDKKHAPITQPAAPAQAQPGQITVTPSVDGQKGTPLAVPNPNQPDQKK
jgi:preprotein translocase subunit SecG